MDTGKFHIALLILMVPVTIEVCLTLRALRRVLDEVPVTVTQLANKLDVHVAATTAEVKELRVQVTSQSRRVAGIADKLVGEVSSFRADITKDVHTTQLEIGSLTRAYAAVPNLFTSRLDRWTDCSSTGLGGACWQAQFTGLLGTARVTSARMSKASETLTLSLPEFTGAVLKSANNSAKTTEAALQTTQSTNLLITRVSDWVQPPPRVLRKPIISVPLYVLGKTWPILLPLF